MTRTFSTGRHFSFDATKEKERTFTSFSSSQVSLFLSSFSSFAFFFNLFRVDHSNSNLKLLLSAAILILNDRRVHLLPFTSFFLG